MGCFFAVFWQPTEAQRPRISADLLPIWQVDGCILQSSEGAIAAIGWCVRFAPPMKFQDGQVVMVQDWIVSFISRSALGAGSTSSRATSIYRRRCVVEAMGRKELPDQRPQAFAEDFLRMIALLSVLLASC